MVIDSENYVGGGRGFQKQKNIKGKYEAKLVFPEGWGSNKKASVWGGMDLFGNNTLLNTILHFVEQC